MEGQKKIVLVTEDEPAMQRILADKLVENGFQVLLASDGEEGLEQSLIHHPHMIIVDLLMPKLDGISMLKKLRQDSWGKNVPTIILTNVSPDTDETLQAIITTQPAYYFVKSNTKLEEIVEKTKEVLSSPPVENNVN